MSESPQFVWNDFCWETEVNLPAFAGFQERKGPYGAISSDSPSNGDVTISLSEEGRDDSPATEDEKKFVGWFIDNSSNVISSFLNIMLQAYPEIKSGYIEEYGDEVIDLFPQIDYAEDMKTVMGLVTIHIHNIAKDGIPIIGLEFGCNWEDEHGLGVLFWKDRILDIGHADTSFVNWIAKESAEKI